MIYFRCKVETDTTVRNFPLRVSDRNRYECPKRPLQAPTASYDFYYIHQTDWTERDQIVMEQLQQKYGILTNIRTGNLTEHEYPI